MRTREVIPKNDVQVTGTARMRDPSTMKIDPVVSDDLPLTRDYSRSPAPLFTSSKHRRKGTTKERRETHRDFFYRCSTS